MNRGCGLWAADCRRLPLVVTLLVAGCLAPLQGAGVTAWEMNSYRDFIAGRFEGLSLTRDGRLALAPRTETLFNPDQPIIWSVVQAPDGTLYAATGHGGRVYRIDPSGKSELLWTADRPEVFALALDRNGVLYAASSPEGKIFRIENGKAQEYFAPEARYIWALVLGQDGALYAGTGDQGKVYRIEGPGKGEVYYETGQSHVTALAFDSQGRLLAGSEPNGILYRISAKDKAFVLYDANLPEIRAIVPAPDGSIYAAALGGSLARRPVGGVPSAPGIPSSASVTVTSTTVTVEAAQAGVEVKPGAGGAQAGAAPAVSAPASPVIDVTGVEKSAIYRIAADNTVESVWSSNEENAYDLVLSGGDILFSTDGKGRIYRLGQDRRLTLLAQTNEGEAVRLLHTRGGLLAATGDAGKLYRLLDGTGPGGTYEAPVHDAGNVARWGRLRWRAEVPKDGQMVFRTRSGNSARPDRTWSEWSEPLADADGSPVPSPNARYIQWKAEFAASGSPGPVLESVSLAYLPQNTPPVLRSISVITQMAAAAQKPAAAQPQVAATYSITVTDTGEAGPSTSAGTPTQALQRPGASQIQITWHAEDADGDRLNYNLYFRGEDEREWKLLKADLTEMNYTVDADVFADGKYFFRVTASDAPSNPPAYAREVELVSAPALIDHTPPVVTAGTPKRAGSRLEVEFEAVDAASPLRRFEYSLNAGAWVPVEPVDGIIDSQREHFVVRLDNLPPGEHLLVVRAVDAAGNAGLARVVVR